MAAMKKHKKRQININTLLKRLYMDVNTASTALFTSVEPLYREAKKKMCNIKREDVEEFLIRQPSYTRHRRAVRRFKRLATIAPGLHTDWQCDLSDMQRLSKENKGYGFFLLCIDSLSRQIFVEPVKTKHATAIVKGFQAIFDRCGYKPWKLVSDAGKEFTARAVQDYLNEHGIKHYCMYTSPQFHAGMAERANRSVKERLYRYFTHANTRTWLAVIQPIVDAINNSPCSSLGGLRPMDVTFDNAGEVREAVKEKFIPKKSGSREYKVGDYVRIERYKHAFQKGYEPNFTSEVFCISELRRSPFPITYHLTDQNGETLKGWFYAQDLSLVKAVESQTWAIERVLEKRKSRRGEECLVQWKGFSKEYNSWIPASSIIQ